LLSSSRGVTSRQTKVSNPVLHVLRMFGLLLTLSLLTGVVAIDQNARLNAASVLADAKVNFSYNRIGAAQSASTAFQLRLGSTHAKLFTAELQDGPEGEEPPVASFVRSYDGDDQIGIRFDFVSVPTPRVDLDVASRRPFHLSYPTYGGIPTGPPSA
jgi:hypothetical protein